MAFLIKYRNCNISVTKINVYLTNSNFTKMLTFKECINKIYPLSPEAFSLLEDNMEIVEYSPKDFLIENKKAHTHKMHFIAKGLLRSYYKVNDKERTLWFVWEGDLVSSLPEYVQIIEPTVLYEIEYHVLKKLMQDNIELSHFYTRILEEICLYYENRVLSLIVNNAKKGYLNLITNHPLLMQRVPLQMIASYLGISQERLSRIRSEKK